MNSSRACASSPNVSKDRSWNRMLTSLFKTCLQHCHICSSFFRSSRSLRPYSKWLISVPSIIVSDINFKNSLPLNIVVFLLYSRWHCHIWGIWIHWPIRNWICLQSSWTRYWYKLWWYYILNIKCSYIRFIFQIWKIKSVIRKSN